MARIIQQAATGNQAVSVAQSSKMRFRARLPSSIKLTQSSSQPQAPGVFVRFSTNMPRQIRSRISHPRSPKLQRTSSADSSDGCNHEIVLSPTGRVAMGPWLGPFETCDESASDSIYFVDPRGIAHVSLVNEVEQAQEAPKRSPTPSLEDFAVSSIRRAHLEEVRQAHSKFLVPNNWANRRNARSAARMNKVHQPRLHY